MNRYYVKCRHTNYYGVKNDTIPLIVDAKTKKAATAKIYDIYNIDKIVEFTNSKPIHKYDFHGKRIG